MPDFFNSIEAISSELAHTFIHTLKDTLVLLPFLFISYLIMELIEHKTSSKTIEAISSSGKIGPLIGSATGIIPQCGFSALASTLYAGRIITLGTLIAVLLSTSDEMIPLMLVKSVPIRNILIILGAKFAIAIILGFLIDFLFKRELKADEEIEEFCNHEHCKCHEDNLLKSSLYHTVHVFVFVFIVTFILNILIAHLGEDKLGSIILNKPFVGQAISALIGLVPNCAASVVITNLYIGGAISAGSLISGLLVGAGVGTLVLFRTNKHLKENLFILAILYISGVVCGILLDFLNFGNLLI